MKSINSKKGDVAVGILVIGVFGLCILTLLSFWLSNTKFKQVFYGLTTAEQVNADIDQYYFYKNAGYTPEESAALIGASIQDGKVVIQHEITSPKTTLLKKLFLIFKKDSSQEYKIITITTKINQ